MAMVILVPIRIVTGVIPMIMKLETIVRGGGSGNGNGSGSGSGNGNGDGKEGGRREERKARRREEGEGMRTWTKMQVGPKRKWD